MKDRNGYDAVNQLHNIFGIFATEDGGWLMERMKGGNGMITEPADHTHTMFADETLEHNDIILTSVDNHVVVRPSLNQDITMLISRHYDVTVSINSEGQPTMTSPCRSVVRVNSKA